MDTIRGVPALADTDAAALVGQYSRDLRTYLWGDSGWVDCTLEPGIVVSGSGMPQVRRLGQVVYFRGAITNAALAASANNNFGTLPSGFNPPAWSYFPALSNTVAAAGRLVIQSGGTLQVTTPSPLGTYYAFNVSYPIN